MPTPPSTRSVKISPDERGGWSSERPRRDGAPVRPVDVSTRCEVLAPSDRLRYTPGSLLLIVSADATEATRVAERVVQERGAVLSPAKVRALLAGRVAPEEIEARASELLDAALAKRLGAGQSVAIVVEDLGAERRESYVRLAHGLRRARHLILLETRHSEVPERERAALNRLRRALDAGELGLEGFQTALRLGGTAVGELQRIVFQRPPRDE
jgi:hypothetical protein